MTTKMMIDMTMVNIQVTMIMMLADIMMVLAGHQMIMIMIIIRIRMVPPGRQEGSSASPPYQPHPTPRIMGG